MSVDNNPDGGTAADGFVAITVALVLHWRAILALPACWAVFYAGHWMSHIAFYCDFNWYTVHNWLLLTSSDIQDWGRIDKWGPWEKIIDFEPEDGEFFGRYPD